ncbi:50S ribosomal protein L20 [Enterobacteriaceae endosymbiont of Donacia semicuprea]|uniref:50S ribosomal protein L20 n=1 Tax=Enterobacteriaceae endosymbiont of Donacia semicuprea TaxID=2675783 RepID=UPI0014499F2F|nr:50S ribosomal protein L20 [Enterobacteriaceae endosymbiont of Donacia semicuprea]QJC32789.1 50S ribosomal protein L20 [Enterobacteriaceae endosymbiont of Donacia semicuprea]
MVRIKRGVTSKARHKKILKQAKGYYGSRSRTYRSAFQAVIKSGQYSYRDRKQKKRKFRQLWIMKINAAVRQKKMSYSNFIYNLKKNNININRKNLADIATFSNSSFNKLIQYSIK